LKRVITGDDNGFTQNGDELETFDSTLQPRVHQLQMASSNAQENILKNEQRKQFNLAAFGTTFEPGSTPIVASVQRRGEWTKEHYDETVRRLKEGGSYGRKWSESKHLHRLHMINTGPSGQPVEHLQRSKGGDDWFIVLHQEMVFDAVYSIHETLGHKKARLMKIAASKTYFNVTEEHCRLLVTTCQQCQCKKPIVIIPSPSTKDESFWDKFVACAVDYSNTPVNLSGEVRARYLLVLQDKATKSTTLRAITELEVGILKYELKYMFAMLGCPKNISYRLDDVSDICSDLANRIIQEPVAKSCTDDSGQVHQLVSIVSNVITDLLTSRQQGETINEVSHESTSWYHVIPEAIEVINRDPYLKVFGMELSDSGSIQHPSITESASTLNHPITVGRDPKRQLPSSDANHVEDMTDPFLSALLQCSHCNLFRGCIHTILQVAVDESFYDSCLDPSNSWSMDLINTFGLLIYHESHSRGKLEDDDNDKPDDDVADNEFVWETIFMDTRQPPSNLSLLLMDTPHLPELPAEIICRIETYLRVPDSVGAVITVAEKDQHWAVLKLKLPPDSTTVVYDDKSDTKPEELEQWREHEEAVLLRCGIDKSHLKMKWHRRSHKRSKDFGYPIDIPAINATDYGPICCRLLWELLQPGAAAEEYGTSTVGRLGMSRNVLSDDVELWRKICIQKLKSMLINFAKDLCVFRNNPSRTRQNNNSETSDVKRRCTRSESKTV
jgi:hypothetical protein